MRSVNSVTLLGYVGQDPKVNATQSGKTVANFSVATSFRTADKREFTEWHHLVAWGRLGEIVRDYVKRGSKIYAEGHLQTRDYDKDGVKTYVTEIVLDSMSLLDSRPADASKSAPLRGSTSDRANTEITDDDIPF
jgi:single-strand DNA-binding protein